MLDRRSCQACRADMLSITHQEERPDRSNADGAFFAFGSVAERLIAPSLPLGGRLGIQPPHSVP
jgi:hypothetical protein